MRRKVDLNKTKMGPEFGIEPEWDRKWTGKGPVRDRYWDKNETGMGPGMT